MKILQVNKFLYPRGGAETYLFGLSELLTDYGHEVVFFSQRNPKNSANDQEKYFISNIELGKLNWKNIFRIGRIFWSYSAAKKIKKLIEAEKPDVVHLHNIYHQISPSILPVIKKAGIPIIMTVHDFKLIKSDYTLRADNIKSGEKPFLADILMKLEFAFHRRLKIYEKNIDLFIAPSQFVRNRLIEGGIRAEKIIYLPHFIDLKNYDGAEEAGDYVLYFGRLDESKGVDILIKAMGNLPLKLKIAGSGPIEPELKKLAKKLNLENQVEFLGRQPKSELIKIIQKSLFTVFPSRVHETFGLGILESFACSKPVIATKAGAFEEIVKENETGLLVGVDNPAELEKAMRYLIDNPDKTKIMGENGRQLAMDKYSPQNHYQELMKIYQK